MSSQFNDNHPTEKRPKVSVLMITYNHEKYIEQAVRSVMMQETDFDYELVIGEDCSTDSTREIVLRLKEEFPDKIKLLLHEKNVGVGKNFRLTYENCRGEYIAFLEGDDYWTDKHKLQIQSELLDRTDDVTLCFHPVERWLEAEQKFGDIISYASESSYDFDDLLNAVIYPHTSSMMIRKSCLEISAELDSLTYVDIIVRYFCAERGKLIYTNRLMSVYRTHECGVWSGARSDIKLKHMIETHMYLNKRYHYKYRYAEVFKIREWLFNLSAVYSYQNNMQQARSTFFTAMFGPNLGRYPSLRKCLKTFVLAFFPHAPILVKSFRTVISR